MTSFTYNVINGLWLVKFCFHLFNKHNSCETVAASYYVHIGMLTHFFHGKSYELILTKKTVGAATWAIFAQTHLVTLIRVCIGHRFFQREIRYRCRQCPLTFLRKKSYIKHHEGKHPDVPAPWCKVRGYVHMYLEPIQ
jgi:uncharacterized membrane protein YecN with MAPEG domain